MNHWQAVPSFAGAATTRLLIERIPATGEAALPAPIFVQQTEVAIVEGRAELDLPVLNVGEVFRITAVGGMFTDDPVVPRETTVRAVHVNELRARIDGQRGRFGLPPFAWANPVAGSGTTAVQALHMVELRNALSGAYAAAGLPPPVWAEPQLTATVSPVRAAHLIEIRAALAALEQQ